MRKWGIYHSLEEVLQVFRSEELASIPEVQEAVTLFLKGYDPEKKLSELHNRHPLIVVEGLDASGKTTVTHLLSKRLGGVKMSTPGPQFAALRPFFDQQPNHIRRAYYSLTNYAAALEINELLEEKPVILDRFWHSTAAYALAGEVDDVAMLPPAGDQIYQWPKDLKPYPEKVIFLQVTEAERMKRISRRQTATAEEDRLAKEANFRKVINEAYRRMYEPQILEVDSTRPVKHVVNEIFDIVSKAK
ncbi:UMP-CMP kinase 2, mitochondrial-like [Thrips palmi]|uniref:UMP-CMP kinase 2, mitochondrial-like n=1 Tax=Thrips palmi TaxID=161013 RepID=A0A6P8XVV8_THRPL|nr:UMP-CMP kinase 2, mitochondrial-like [Thrips palmi]